MVNITKKLLALWRMPLSRQLQYFRLLRYKLLTHWVYSYRLKACSSGSIVCRPLFWTPEYISIGSEVLVWPGCRIEGIRTQSSNTSPHIHLGDGVTLQQNCHVTAGSDLYIGSGTTILFDVMITDIDHSYDLIGISIIRQPINVNETRIGKNCFIGSGAKILAGTTLGEQCVVGANAVVRGTFPPYSVIGGIPARVIKQFDEASQHWIRTEH